jgi:hypothetical protein
MLLAVGLLGGAACVSPSPEPPAPSPDAGPLGVPEGGGFDVAIPDTGPGADVARPDAGPDATPPDGSPGDTGGPDTNPPDAGPCAANNGGCPADSTCADDAGVAQCTCNAGYGGPTCASLCATNNGGCDPNATCSNGPGGVVCACNAGYTGNGTTCASDCATNNGGCDPNATCSNGDGGVACTCNAGYAGSGTTCTSLCATNNGGCDPHATCSNGPGGVLCACNPGYTGTGAQCTSLCATNNGGCDPNATCSNGPSGVLCACNPGFNGNGATCSSDDYASWPAPPVSPLEAQYAVDADGVLVMDRSTGLVWQRQLTVACPQDDDAGDGCTYADAQAYCASLNGIGLGGLSSGWRVPSLVELVSIVNYTDGTPAIDTALFPGTPVTAFWSNTPAAQAAGDAWAVSFVDGSGAPQATSTVSPIRCVNSSAPGAVSSSCGQVGQACCYAASCAPDAQCNAGTCGRAYDYAQVPPAPDYPPEAAYLPSKEGATVFDKATGLYWQRALPAAECPADGAGCTWAHAAAYCQSLNALGVGGISAGWRLPSLPELVSIVNYGQPASPPVAALDTAVFGDPPLTSFWSSTASAQSGASAWALSFVDGSASPAAEGSPLPVRCVSSLAPTGSLACGLLGEACCYANACGSGLACSGGACIVDRHFDVAPPPTDFPLEAAFSVSDDGTIVRDTATGLYWQRQVFSNPCPGDGAGVCTAPDAATYCASLSTNMLGGITTGWRVPTLDEALSILNYGPPNTFLDTAIFPPVPDATFWTSTPSAHSAGAAWTVDTGNGSTAVAADTSAFAVRCVSVDAPSASPAGCGLVGDPCCYAASCGPALACGATNGCEVDRSYAQVVTTDEPREAAYTVSPGGSVVTDIHTGLVWQRQVEAAPCPAEDAGTPGCTWTDAAAYCATMNGVALGGYSTGWRLPTVHELVSLINYQDGASTPTIATALFPGTPPAPFWTSTPFAQSAGSALMVSFQDGSEAAEGESSIYGVRCVNTGTSVPAPEGCGALQQACCHTGACAAGLACAGGACVKDVEYTVWPAPPDTTSAGQYTTSGAGVITDATTGLRWAQPGGGTMTWSSAGALCASLDTSALGNLGWRLPTYVELLSIVDYGVSAAPFVQTSVFTSVTAAQYWTATGGPSAPWLVNFSDGSTGGGSATSAHGVLCVSSN